MSTTPTQNKFNLPNSTPSILAQQGIVNNFSKSFLQTGGAQQGRSYGPRNFNFAPFYASGNFTVPTGVTVLNFFMGGGGGGGGSSGTSGTYGGYGAPGQILSGSIQVSPGDVIGITTGAGGLGNINTGGGVGGPGGTTQLSFAGGTTLIDTDGGGGGFASGQGGPGSGFHATYGSVYPQSSFFVVLPQIQVPGSPGTAELTSGGPPLYTDFYTGGTYVQGGPPGQNYAAGNGYPGVVYLSWA